MPSETNKILESQIRDDRQRRWGRVFNAVSDSYIAVINLPVLTAFNYDIEATGNCKQITATYIHFITDVEHAVQAALGADQTLHKAWLDLIDEKTVPSGILTHLAVKCGRLFENRHLHPREYFREIKKGRRDWRPYLRAHAPAKVAA